MNRKEYTASHGKVVYWISEPAGGSSHRETLIFLPGLLADHKLFDEQIRYFESEYSCFTWDTPAHAQSRPYSVFFTLEEIAGVLNKIIKTEGIDYPILIGQSFGAYIGQMYTVLYPDSAVGFISLNSAPIQEDYYTYSDMWFLQCMGAIYALTPNLKKTIAWQCSNTKKGQKYMEYALSFYSRSDICVLSGQGFLSIYFAVCENLPYSIDCPALLICGKEDRSRLIIQYNKKWSVRSGIHIEWVENAGHNVNTDNPDKVNQIIFNFLNSIY